MCSFVFEDVIEQRGAPPAARGGVCALAAAPCAECAVWRIVICPHFKRCRTVRTALFTGYSKATLYNPLISCLMVMLHLSQ